MRRSDVWFVMFYVFIIIKLWWHQYFNEYALAVLFAVVMETLTLVEMRQTIKPLKVTRWILGLHIQIVLLVEHWPKSQAQLNHGTGLNFNGLSLVYYRQILCFFKKKFLNMPSYTAFSLFKVVFNVKTGWMHNAVSQMALFYLNKRNSVEWRLDCDTQGTSMYTTWISLLCFVLFLLCHYWTCVVGHTP